MDLYPRPPLLTFPPSNPELHQSLGDRQLPPEMIREIYSWVIEADTTGVIPPLSVPPVGAYMPGLNGKAPGVYIVSSCPLMRAYKASRSLYHSMLTHEILNSRYQHLQVLVRDFNFASVVHGLINPIMAEAEKKSNNALANLKSHPFTIRLIWTKAWLGSQQQ